MTCIVVDDEPLARQGLEMSIATIGSMSLSGSFSNAVAANDFLLNQKIDLMFLDINMPEISGLEFLKSLRDAPLVIFTTAYPQYALESYELDAIDYLVKPNGAVFKSNQQSAAAPEPVVTTGGNQCSGKN